MLNTFRSPAEKKHPPTHPLRSYPLNVILQLNSNNTSIQKFVHKLHWVYVHHVVVTSSPLSRLNPRNYFIEIQFPFTFTFFPESNVLRWLNRYNYLVFIWICLMATRKRKEQFKKCSVVFINPCICSFLKVYL